MILCLVAIAMGLVALILASASVVHVFRARAYENNKPPERDQPFVSGKGRGSDEGDEI